MLFPAHGLPAGARVRNVADVTAVILYVAIAALAVAGGTNLERADAVLLTALVFLGFNVAWLFLFAPLTATGTASSGDQPGPEDSPLAE